MCVCVCVGVGVAAAPEGPHHHTPAAVPSQGRAVAQHTATGLGATGEAAAAPDLQRLSHPQADAEGGAYGHQHRHLPCGHG